MTSSASINNRIAETLAKIPSAAEAQQQDVDELKKVALLVADNKKLREEKAALIDKVNSLESEKTVLTRLVAIERERGDLYLEASKNRKEAGDVSDVIRANYDKLLARADTTIEKQAAEIQDLRNPSFFKELFNPKELFKIGGSFALGRLTCGQ